ncbi:uncharacterized protein [Physcomitrium patens]|uniref:uncharacterized protein isoform X1 n=1 Tax=Physcomitrium patens TaxID=3218 RepID=UPI003CCD994D
MPLVPTPTPNPPSLSSPNSALPCTAVPSSSPSAHFLLLYCSRDSRHPFAFPMPVILRTHHCHLHPNVICTATCPFPRLSFPCLPASQISSSTSACAVSFKLIVHTSVDCSVCGHTFL